VRDESAWPITFLIQIDQQIEVKIDDPTSVKPDDSFFDRFFHLILWRRSPCHAVA